MQTDGETVQSPQGRHEFSLVGRGRASGNVI
jgi:hypothetical protein